MVYYITNFQIKIKMKLTLKIYRMLVKKDGQNMREISNKELKKDLEIYILETEKNM